MSLKDKLAKNTTIKESALLKDSKIYGHKDNISTAIPMINVALSGKLDGGFTSGLTVIAGASKHFKTAFTLLMASAFLKKYPDGMILFYDSEFGTPESYVQSFGINPDNIFHSPIANIEQLKFDIIAQLEGLDRNDKVFIMIDSVGNLASKKEVEDAIDQKSVADMTRAKALKSLFRIVTPYLTVKDLPMIVVNHTYKEQGLFPKDIVSGGTGIYYSADTIWIVTRRQEKEGDEIVGFNFDINIEKSRYLREKSKIPITVHFEEGIQKWSGFFELAEEGQYIVKTKKGWYGVVDKETGEISEKNYRRADLANNTEFWKNILTNTDFSKYIEQQYILGQVQMVTDETPEKIELENEED